MCLVTSNIPGHPWSTHSLLKAGSWLASTVSFAGESRNNVAMLLLHTYLRRHFTYNARPHLVVLQRASYSPWCILRRLSSWTRPTRSDSHLGSFRTGVEHSIRSLKSWKRIQYRRVSDEDGRPGRRKGGIRFSILAFTCCRATNLLGAPRE